LRSYRSRGAAVFVASAAIACSFAGVASADAPDTPVAAPFKPSSTQTAARITQYWTPARMRSAIPADGQAATSGLVESVARGAAGRSTPAQRSVFSDVKIPQSTRALLVGSTAAPWPGSATAPPATTSGKVFFTKAGLNYVCSGSAINSNGKRVVFTAGHCVHSGGPNGAWHTNWAFVPAYNNGARPYGTWTAAQPWSLNGWINSSNRAYDIGAVVTNLLNGRRLVNVVGGQGIEWNFPLVQYMYQFGYPSRAPFNGQTLQYCSNWTYNDGGFEGINCNMTEGASGGGWLDDFGGQFGWLDGVNSWVFWNAQGVRYKWNSPYFGNGARDLFNAVANL
jgi:hypothetical protein